jgi:putative endonuclease
VSSKSSNQSTGKIGERIAEDFLKKQGYIILERNVRFPLGEIDLIAKHGESLVFVEVKTRRSADFGLPEESITARKKTRLGRLASWYLMNHFEGHELSIRFDVLAIQLRGTEPIIRLIPNAFELSS